MEPLRADRARLDWTGWIAPGKGVRPQDGQLCMLRVQEVDSGLCPRETIREILAVHRDATGWEERQGRQLGYLGNLIAWRPATPQEHGCRW